MRGVIEVTDEGISISRYDQRGCTCASGSPRTIEGLEYSSGVLSRWLELPYEDRGAECKRVCERDQFDAAIREMFGSFDGGEVSQ